MILHLQANTYAQYQNHVSQMAAHFSSSLLDVLKGPNLITAEEITINSAALEYINNLAHKTSESVCARVANKVEKHKEKPKKKPWVEIGQIVLHKKDRKEIVTEKPLTDLHVGAYQQLLKSQVANLKGLQHPVLLQSFCGEFNGQGLTLRVLHIRSNHWVAMQVISSSRVHLYDSSYTSISEDTQFSISRLLNSKEREITVHLMNIQKQTGSSDCALFAMACIKHLAMGKDPTSVIFRQSELRLHLIKSLETKTIKQFPV